MMRPRRPWPRGGAPIRSRSAAVIPPVMNVLHPEALLAATEELLAAEQQDAVELKRLAKSLRRSSRRSLWPLLIDAMTRDTAKHEAILRFLRDRLREQVDNTPTR